MSFKIHQIPLWEDNYIYALHERRENKTAVIDPGEAKAVQRFLKAQGLRLDYILNTHHHFDHTGGNLELKKAWGCPIIGFKGDERRIPGIDIALSEREKLSVGALRFEILFVPGHTLGHIAFWNESHQILFCGDTVFAMGCGRLFEGSPEQMFESLGKIKKLPKKSLLYCAHEYSLKNGRFALSLDPSNPKLKQRFKKVSALRERGQPTVPFYLEEELLTNPFFKAKTVSEFSRIRKLRDRF